MRRVTGTVSPAGGSLAVAWAPRPAGDAADAHPARTVAAAPAAVKNARRLKSG
jgi:hypothetical protein